MSGVQVPLSLKFYMLFSPLDQFKIAPLFSLVIANLDFSPTNFLLVTVLTLFVIQTFVFFIKDNISNSFFIIPSGWQHLIEKLYGLVMQLLSDIIMTGSERYFPFMSVLFVFILSNNLIGLVPYSFTITSHITLTFLMSFSIFVAMNIIGFQKHGIELFSLFFTCKHYFFFSFVVSSY